MHSDFARRFAACFIAVFRWLLSGLPGCLFKPLRAGTHRQIRQGFGFETGSLVPCFSSIAPQNKRLGTQSLHKQGRCGQLFGAWFGCLCYGFFCRTKSIGFGHSQCRFSCRCQSLRIRRKLSGSKRTFYYKDINIYFLIKFFLFG